MRRVAKVRGVPLRFVMFRDDENYLTIIGSVPPTDLAAEVSKETTLETLARAIETATTESRCFSACRAWGVVEVEPKPQPENQVERVSGHASRSAFSGTLKAWGAKMVDGIGIVLRCNKAGLFLDATTREFDARLQADFWRECSIYDDWLSESSAVAAKKATEFRENAARQRQGERREQEGPKVDPANCFHDYQERPDPERSGWLKTSCPHCGKVLGSRPEKSK